MMTATVKTSSTNPQLMRLRLAARTLVEWRTPQSSEYYKAIMESLIDSNALAKDFGLTLKHQIISLDERGSLLWYLSDTLEADSLTSAANSVAGPEPILMLHFGRLKATRALELFEHSTDIVEFANVWMKPHNVGDVLDVLYNGIRSETDLKYYSLSIIVCLAIITPIYYPKQREHIRELMSYHRPCDCDPSDQRSRTTIV
jgi:hypothetical protein